jgi:hypothetical protein
MPQRELQTFFYLFVSIHNALIAEAHVELSYPCLFFLHCYISLLSTGKDCRYRAAGIPARIYHVELTAEVVPLAKRRRLSQ